MHELRYGTCAPGEPAEIVSLRTTVTGVMRKPPQRKIAARHRGAAAGGLRRHAAGLFPRAAASSTTPTFTRAALTAGNRIKGPALIEEHASTTVLMPGDTLDRRRLRQSGHRRRERTLIRMASPKRTTKARKSLDPVITEIVRNGVIAVTEEMKTNLMRTAYNMIIYEALDFTVGLFTPKARRCRSASACRCSSAAWRRPSRRRSGISASTTSSRATSYVTNDAYITGSHLNHVTLTLPIFHGGELVGFSCCMAHWLDIGGALGGMTTDIYSEGLQIPILKYQDRGKVNAGPRRHHPP